MRIIAIIAIAVVTCALPCVCGAGEPAVCTAAEESGFGGAGGTLRLEGTITSGEKAIAIINGQFYRKGDCIMGFSIRSIERDVVIIEGLEVDAPIMTLRVR